MMIGIGLGLTKGGAATPANAVVLRDGSVIQTRAGDTIVTRST